MVDFSDCVVSPYLGYLRSHLKLLLVRNKKSQTNPKKYEQRSRYSPAEAVERLALQPLLYSFYLKNVLEPYRSQFAVENSPYPVDFCFLDKNFDECDDWVNHTGCVPIRDVGFCKPVEPGWTRGHCRSCYQLKYYIKTFNKTDADYVMATCDPSSRGPNPVPQRSPGEKNTTKEIRYLRWFLESSFVLQKKKAGDECSASPELIKARAYLHLLMKKHFGNVSGIVSLTTPGMEGSEDEIAYEAARAELNGNRTWWEEKLMGIKDGKDSFGEVYCSREEGLVCVEGKCRDCGDERVGKNKDLKEVCGRKDDEGSDSSGIQQGRMWEIMVISGMVSTTLLGSFRW
jgi:hypothetical protein